MSLQTVSGSVTFDATPATGCGDCGSIQQAAYFMPATQGEVVSGETGSLGCQATNTVQGCSSGDCGSVVEGGTVDGVIVGSPVEGSVIESGVVSEGTIIHETGTPAADSSSNGTVPDPPTVAPEPSDVDQDA